jgi:hypothetical protein
MKILDEQFRNGQASYQRGIGLRAIFEQITALQDEAKEAKDISLAETKEAESVSLALGYLDGIVASIRRTDNLLLMPAGPDK